MVRKIIILFFLGSSVNSYTRAQIQTIPLHGIITDNEGIPIPEAELTLSFNGNELAKTRSDSGGQYRFLQTYYGEVHEADIAIKSAEYKKLNLKNVPLDSIPLDITLKKRYGNGNGIVIYGERPPIITCGDRPYITHSSGGMLRMPWGTFTYHKTGWDEPIPYYPKITHSVTVVDKAGNSVPEAIVHLRFQNEKDFWGRTDSSGKLDFYIQFLTAANSGSVRVEAPGYRSRYLVLQSFLPTNRSTYILAKKKRKSPAGQSRQDF